MTGIIRSVSSQSPENESVPGTSKSRNGSYPGKNEENEVLTGHSLKLLGQLVYLY